ncbi:hypothetical protein HZS_2238, partial [Henneguya salminicola]
MDCLITQVEKLCSLDLSYDVPPAEVEPISLNYVANFDSNFEDYPAFSIGMSRFLEESDMIKRINVIAREGSEVYCSLLYTWRSISRALPILSDDDPRKMDFYKDVILLMEKAIEPLFDFFKYTKNSHTELVDIVATACKQDCLCEGLSDGILTAIGRLIDVLSVLDCLKNAKTSVKNDLSAYKRYIALLKAKSGDVEYLQMINNLTIYLAQPYTIMDALKKSLENIPESTLLIAQVIANCCNLFENQVYFSPTERFGILRTILAGLYLISGDKNAIAKLDQFKAPLSKVDRIIRSYPSLGLTGDMHIHTAHMLKRLNFNFAWSLLDVNFTSKQASQFNIISYFDVFENEHIAIISDFSIKLNSSGIRARNIGIDDISSAAATDIYNFTIKALKLIGKWDNTLQEVFFYKLSHPADRSAVTEENADAIDNYSLATKYNYNHAEKSAISRIIFFIKSTCEILRQSEDLLTAAINKHIYNVFQEFAHGLMVDIQKKSSKCKNQLFKMVIQCINLISTDKVFAAENLKQKKGEKSYTLHSKSVPPLSSQLYMARTMLDALLTMKESKKYIDSTTLQQAHAFIAESAFFPAMINFHKTLLECGQMNIFWFKEFYIEIAAGKCVQYSVDESYPGIMTNHLSESNESNFYEFILYIQGIYNDAADYVLQNFKRTYLYDEIDAEGSLVIEKGCYHLSEKIYSAIRAEAFSVLVDKSLKNNILKRLTDIDKSLITESTIIYQTAQHYSNLCQQRTIQFLGRKIDFNALLSQRLFVLFKKSIDACISYFEASPLENIVLISALIDVYELTHSLLRRNFDLPDFTTILNEANGKIPGYVPRITNQVIISLLNDVVPNYSYCCQTERLIKSPITYTNSRMDPPKTPIMALYGSKAMAIGFEDYYSLYSKYIGIPHLEAIFKLIGYSGVLKIVEEIKTALATLVDTSLKEFVEALLNGMPMKSNLPRAAYGFSAALQLYEASFQAIINYAELNSGVLHHLRILGNYIIIVYLLERSIYSVEARSIYLTSAFNGVFSSPSNPDQQIYFEQNNTIVNLYKNFMIEDFPIVAGDEKFKNVFQKATILNQEKLCCGLSMFCNLLEFLQSKVNTPFWRGPEPTNNVISIEENNEFHRLFSVLEYCLCISSKKAAVVTNDLMFGDGILFGSLSIITVLGQLHRYEAFDFCDHAISISEIDPASTVPLLQSSVFYGL